VEVEKAIHEPDEEQRKQRKQNDGGREVMGQGLASDENGRRRNKLMGHKETLSFLC